MPMPTASLVFVVPDPGATLSGGHVYNARVVHAIREMGHAVQVLGIDSFAARVHRDVPGRYAIDSMFLAALPGLPIERVDARLIVHHLESLAPTGERSADEVFTADEEPVLRRCRGFVATSQFTADYLRERGFPATRIVVAPPAWDGFRPADTPATRTSAAVRAHVRALVVANLVERKQVLELLDALAAVLRGTDPIAMRIVGGDTIEPSYAAACRLRVESDPVLRAKVVLAGTVPHASMPAEYRAADVMVSAARMETFGMALQEAVASGLPLLVADRGFAGAHADGAHGIRFPDCGALALGLRELAADPRRLVELRAAARCAHPLGAPTWSESARRLLAAWDAPPPC